MVLKTCAEFEGREKTMSCRWSPWELMWSLCACSRGEGRTRLGYPAFPSFIMSVFRRLLIVLPRKKASPTSLYKPIRHRNLGKTQEKKPSNLLS